MSAKIAAAVGNLTAWTKEANERINELLDRVEALENAKPSKPRRQTTLSLGDKGYNSET